jgi:hypothetical protein
MSLYVLLIEAVKAECFSRGGVVAAASGEVQVSQRGPHSVEGIGGHHGADQVQRLQELGEMAGLVVPVADLKVVQQVPAVIRGAEQVDPGAVVSFVPPSRGAYQRITASGAECSGSVTRPQNEPVRP